MRLVTADEMIELFFSKKFEKEVSNLQFNNYLTHERFFLPICRRLYNIHKASDPTISTKKVQDKIIGASKDLFLQFRDKEITLS